MVMWLTYDGTGQHEPDLASGSMGRGLAGEMAEREWGESGAPQCLQIDRGRQPPPAWSSSSVRWVSTYSSRGSQISVCKAEKTHQESVGQLPIRSCCIASPAVSLLETAVVSIATERMADMKRLCDGRYK